MAQEAPIIEDGKEYAWSPQDGTQADAISATWCRELLFGGARGGGKSDFLLGDYLQDVTKYGEHWQGAIFRKTYPQLEELISRAKAIFAPTGGYYLEGKSRYEWPNGAKLRFRHLEKESDADNYQGHQYPFLAFDELGSWKDDTAYRKLIACNRWAAMHLPTKRIRGSANPGGVGHEWIKERWEIGNYYRGYQPIFDETLEHYLMFIPSRLEDNKILMDADPGYKNALRGVGSPELVRAWLEGDWDAVPGAYFPEFSKKTHVLAPFDIPERWVRFRAFDWGSARPFCCLWFAVSDGDPRIGLPAGCLVVYREWYGASGPNKGIHMHIEDVGRGIKEREAHGEKIAYSVCDPSMYKQDGGPSLVERIVPWVTFQPGDNTRVPGWDQIRSRLLGEENMGPMLYLFSTCINSIRTFPMLQHDPRHLEDAATEGEDHSMDTLRYGCMSRPWHRPLPKPTKKIRTLADMTFGEIVKMQSSIRA